jgi:hypothetical protein
MHVHSTSASNPMMALGLTQSAQQATAARKAAAEVRRKLTGFAATEDGEITSRVESRSEADPDRRQRQQNDEESFRSVFFSASA